MKTIDNDVEGIETTLVYYILFSQYHRKIQLQRLIVALRD
jgi:hypothetical protein